MPQFCVDPLEFCAKSSGFVPPWSLFNGVDETMAGLFKKMSQSSPAAMSKERTLAMRKWVLRAAELKAAGIDGKEILQRKNLKLFGFWNLGLLTLE